MGAKSRANASLAAHAELTIGQLSKRVGITPRTLRYYEDIGLLNTVKRVEGGRRVYTAEDIRRLKFIQRLKVLGLSLDEMKDLEDLYDKHRSNDKVLPKLLELLSGHLETIESRIDELRMLKRDIEAYKHHIEAKL